MVGRFRPASRAAQLSAARRGRHHLLRTPRHGAVAQPRLAGGQPRVVTDTEASEAGGRVGVLPPTEGLDALDWRIARGRHVAVGARRESAVTGEYRIGIHGQVVRALGARADADASEVRLVHAIMQGRVAASRRQRARKQVRTSKVCVP